MAVAPVRASVERVAELRNVGPSAGRVVGPLSQAARTILLPAAAVKGFSRARLRADRSVAQHRVKFRQRTSSAATLCRGLRPALDSSTVWLEPLSRLTFHEENRWHPRTPRSSVGSTRSRS